MRRSSLRCFFFDMRLRRFLITEPIWVFPHVLSSVPARTPVTYACCRRWASW
ncbi:hypothetical protein RAJCM14343_5669 [Rhodococcus aetherivorans]|uniref:Uncharacterized protein n=1 Tax=Rhodococcus aetherivorans TaxID=191292 RepID=A0ABQ0YUQ7_9NOCA|nr:hypothetical protein RAJCM14343_5669 [Rhodococcus aetherivorans]CCW11461.1 hypothetical protein EBESD8_19990 [Rhodococcus aetherivorans]